MHTIFKVHCADSDVVGEQKSGSGRVRGSKFRGRPPRVSGISRGFKLKFRVGVGSGSTFRGRVGFGDHNVRVVPLGFRGFGSPITSLTCMHYH